MAKEVAKIFTKLFPNKSAPIKRSLSLVYSSAFLVPLDFNSVIPRSFALLAAVNAVSEPEKNADRSNKKMIDATVNHIVVSKLVKKSFNIRFHFSINLF